MVEIPYWKAVNEALRRSLSEHPEALFFGEDVAIPGGVFGVSRGLRAEFGDRVFDTPISESAMLGAAVGAAMVGRRPIVEIMWADFLFVGIDQLINHAAHVRYLSCGEAKAPLTIRTQQGALNASSAQHSRCIESILTHVPGLKVAMPSCPEDAYAILRAAVADDDPCVVIENRALYTLSTEVDLDCSLDNIGRARVRRQGTDVTVVALSRMVDVALRAADQLERQGISCEVIDPRWVCPLDRETIERSLDRTGRLVIVHEAVKTSGFGAELAAIAASEWFWLLDAPVARVTAPDVPKPSAPALELAYLPDAADVVRAVSELVSGDSISEAINARV